MYEVHEVHDWPGRAAPGPRVLIWHGRDKQQAEAVCERLSADCVDYSFYYEVVER